MSIDMNVIFCCLRKYPQLTPTPIMETAQMRKNKNKTNKPKKQVVISETDQKAKGNKTDQ